MAIDYQAYYRNLTNPSQPRQAAGTATSQWADMAAQSGTPMSATQMTGMQPGFGNFSALAPTPPPADKPVDYQSMAMPGMQATLGEVRESAYQDYMARQLQQLDLQRQGSMQAGADRYQQARMAMEQQRALSDTRGLTAGAAAGAQGQLSAQQQVALNTIEQGTMADLRQLESQGISLEFAASEWANQKVAEFKQTDEAWVGLEASGRALEIAKAGYDSDPTNLEAQQAYNEAEETYLRYLSQTSGVNFDAHIERVGNRFTTDPNASPYDVLSEEFVNTVTEAGTPRGVDNIAGVGMDLAPAAIAAWGAKGLKGWAVGGTKAKLAAGTANKVTTTLMAGYQASAATANAANVTITAAKVGSITNTGILSSVAKALGATTAELTKASTAKTLQALITKKLGASGTAAVAKTALGKSAAATLATGKSSLLLAKGAMLLKGAGAVIAAKPILAAAAIAAVGYGLYLGYGALKKHFGENEAAGKMGEVMAQEEQNLIADGMSQEEARSIIGEFVSLYPALNLG